MAIITALWARIWPYIAVVGAALAGVLAVRHSGKSAARAEDAARAARDKAKTDKEVRDVAQKVSAMDDHTVDSRLDEWVRHRDGR